MTDPSRLSSPSTDPPSPPAWRALLRELPLLLGVAFGIYGLWRFGSAFVLTNACPHGHGWWDLFEEARGLQTGHLVSATSWRKALYLIVLGFFGERHGYLITSILLSSLFSVATVIGAGLGARALGNAWVGGLAAMVVPLDRVTATASRWGTFYPPLAGATALTVGIDAALLRWPHPLLALAAGLVAVLTWNIDQRGFFLIPISLVAMVLAALRTKGRDRLLIPIAFVAAVAVGTGLDRVSGARTVPFAEQLTEQGSVAKRWVYASQDRALIAACGSRPVDERPSIEGMTSNCARELVRFTLEKELPRDVPFPVSWLLIALPVAFLPGKQDWKMSLGAIVCLGGTLGLLVAQMVWLPVQDRYVLQFAGPIAMLVPLAVARAFETPFRILRRVVSRPWLGGIEIALIALLTSGIAIWQLRGGTPESKHATYAESSQEEMILCDALPSIRAIIGPEDPILECTDLHVASALLPRPGLMGRRVDWDTCQKWTTSYPSSDRATWLVTTQDLAPDASLWQKAGEWNTPMYALSLWKLAAGSSEPASP